MAVQANGDGDGGKKGRDPVYRGHLAFDCPIFATLFIITRTYVDAYSIQKWVNLVFFCQAVAVGQSLVRSRRCLFRGNCGDGDGDGDGENGDE